MQESKAIDEFIEYVRGREQALSSVLSTYRERLEAAEQAGDEGATFDAYYGVDFTEGRVLAVREVLRVTQASAGAETERLVAGLENSFLAAEREADRRSQEWAAAHRRGMMTGETGEFTAATRRLNFANGQQEEFRTMLLEARGLI